ncbi:MAG TPA: hypothetical protein GX525_09855 [Bacilli bacterium]|nr:hypothetical protein [Bacilli bacterium]
MYKQKGMTALYSSIVATLFVSIVFYLSSNEFFESIFLTFILVSLYVFPIIFLFALPVSIAYEYLFRSEHRTIWTSLFWHVGFAALPNLFVFFNHFDDGLVRLNMLSMSVPAAIIFVFFDTWTKKKAKQTEFAINRTQKGALLLIPTILALGFYFLFLHMDYRSPNQYIIPDGYVGWVYVYYNVSDAEPLPKKNGKFLLEIDESGMLSTSNSIEYGAALDEYYYISNNGELKQLPFEEMIFAASTGSSNAHDGEVTTYERFFVGSEAQFEQYENSSN